MFINQQGQYVYKTKPLRCRNCASKAIASYVFGFPVDFVYEDQLLPRLQQHYQIGGCAVELGEFEKSWHCKSCGMDFYKKNNNVYREQAK